MGLEANEVEWAERSGVRAIAADGTLLGPFNPLLFNPVLGAAQVAVFRADKSSTSLSARVHEIVVLTVGAAWSSHYELDAHSAVGESAGLEDAVVRAIIAGDVPPFRADDETCAHRFTWQLAHRHTIDRETFAWAVQLFGYRGVVDMVLLIGLYMTTCSIINAFEVAVPEPVEP